MENRRIEGLTSLNLVSNSGDVIRAAERNRRDLFLANEDSLFDAERISSFGDTMIAQESVDLSKQTGNARAICALETMRSKKGAFFPGAALRDFGEFYALAMPVIIDGNIVGERVKLNQPAYIKSFRESASIRRILPSSGRISLELESRIRDEIAHELDDIALKSVRSFSYDGETILPVLCNELSIMPQVYSGNPVSLVFHSCANYADSPDEREAKYDSFIKEMRKRNLLADSFSIAYVDNSSSDERVPSAAGFYHF